MRRAMPTAGLICAFLICGAASRGCTADNFADPAACEAFDAGNTGGLQAQGYFGAAFDGRYVYYAPCRTAVFHGVVLRYDTTGSFQAPGSWAACDAGHTDGLRTVGYAGAVYQAPYVYFVPYHNGVSFSGIALRYRLSR